MKYIDNGMDENHCLLDNCGWTLATRNTGKRTRRKRIFAATTICRAIRSNDDNNNILTTTTDSSSHSLDLVDGMKKRVTEFKNHLTLAIKFKNSIFFTLHKILDGQRLTSIRAVGIGPFSVSADSMYQLAFLELLKEDFRVPFVTYQDPLTTDNEKCYLHSQGIHVLPPDDFCSNPRPTATTFGDTTDSGGFILFYMIHCAHDLYNFVLSQYCTNIGKIIVIGNDYHNIPLTLNTASISDAAYLSNFIKICRMIPLPCFEAKQFAFNATAIWFVDKEEE